MIIGESKLIWIRNFWNFSRCKYTVRCRIAKWETIRVEFDEVSQSARRSISQQVASFLFQKVRADQTNLAVTSVLTLRGRLRVGVPLSSQRGRELSRGKNEKSVEIKKLSFRREALWTHFGGVKSTVWICVRTWSATKVLKHPPPPMHTSLEKVDIRATTGWKTWLTFNYIQMATNTIRLWLETRWFKDSYFI